VQLKPSEQPTASAALSLMPRRAFSREFNGASFSFKHVFDLKKRWQASAAAIVRRGYDLGLLSAVAIQTRISVYVYARMED